MNPDDFRVVDQWGRRFYVDPLPTCPIAAATDEQWPSVSVTKKAWDKPFQKRLGERMVGLDALRAATFAVDNVGAWVDLPRDAALEMIATAPQRDLAAAGHRGTDIHRVIETLAAGGDPVLDVTPNAVPFLDTAAKVVAELAPRLILAETVAVCRTLGGGGVAGTFDFYGHLAGFDGPVLVDWKAQPVDTPTLTPTGWVKIGDLRIGDRVIGSNGKATTVVGVHPQGVVECVEIELTDSTVVRCSPEHYWTLRDGRGPWRTLTISDVVATGLRRGNNYRWELPGHPAVEFEPPVPAPVDPYILGVLIGDGCLRGRGGVEFTKPLPSLHDEVRARLPEGYQLKVRDKGCCSISGPRGANAFLDYLRAVGLDVNSVDRFIPEDLQRMSVKDRRALLAGLMDTDGSCSSGKGRKRVTFYTSSPRLRDDVVELVRGLGGVARVFSIAEPTYTHGGERRVSPHPAFVITISAPWNPFRESGRASSWEPPIARTHVRRIRAVRPVDPREMVCISVAAQDGLYVTEGHVVTHNTRSSAHAAYPEECAQLGAYSLADYVIAETGAGRKPARARLGDITGLVIVSIAADGYEVFPVDLALAREAAEAMVAGWHLKMGGQRAARRAAGKALPATAPDTEPPVANRWESPERRAWIRDRVRALVDAGHGDALARRWPPGVPTLAAEPNPPFSHINLIAVACRSVEDEVEFPFGPRDPSHGPTQRPPAPAPASPLPEAGVGGPELVAGDHPDVVAIVERLKALPEDLLAGVAATAHDHGIANIEMGTATSEQLAMLRGWVAAVEAAHETRKAHVASIASDLRGVDDELWAAVCAAVGDVEPQRWTDDHVEALGAYVAAIEAGMVALAWTDDATPVLVPASDAEGRLVAVFGTKTAVRDAARPLADRMGAKARSVADIAADPALVAHLVAAGPPSAA